MNNCHCGLAKLIRHTRSHFFPINLKAPFYMLLITEELEENYNSNLLSIRHVELGNSFKSLELDTDSSRGSRESLDSLASSITDEQSLDRVTFSR